jgi:hypothetical protein
MNGQKIVASIPWGKVVTLIAKLIRFSKGGIDKAEGAELAEDLLLLAADLIDKSK